MHKSRLGSLIIDCQTDDLTGAAEFWGEALGCSITNYENDEEYFGLENTDKNEPHIEVQSVDHESRVHIDIETDDFEAETARLEKLGAKRIAAIKTWVVMEAPTGQRFCLVPPQRENFDQEANQWNE
ncbi:MAG: VOC family protein [Gammaproteobacteria bacterium]|nr:VOC family protein [Gammaproteobacteria bacterium]